MELIRQICTEFARGYFERESSFYGSLKAREDNNLLTVNGIIWQKLSEGEKHIYAQKREAEHLNLEGAKKASRLLDKFLNVFVKE